ncbi:MAG: TIGR04255 family protein, partial [Deltaproteobacteria bacterium]|nr:TIGR04255 family protein [Deltaproteobacteria bacterium]
KVTGIPIINRVGLRYVDECPMFERTNESFKSLYNTTFPITRFAIQDAHEMFFNTLIKRGDYRLRYVEALQPKEKGGKLTLDFDAYMTNVNADDLLTVTDDLHDLILAEYEKTIKNPIIEYMRKTGEA